MVDAPQADLAVSNGSSYALRVAFEELQLLDRDGNAIGDRIRVGHLIYAIAPAVLTVPPAK